MNITKAMSEISDKYIDELKNVGMPIKRRRSFRPMIIAAALVSLVVCVSLFSVIGSQPPETPIIPPDFSETLSQNTSANSDEKFNNASTEISDSSDCSDETSNQNTSIPNDNSSSNEESEPDENSNNESSWNPPHIDENGASFTAQQIADIFGTKEDGGTNKYQVFGFESVKDIKTGSIPQGNLPMIL